MQLVVGTTARAELVTLAALAAGVAAARATYRLVVLLVVVTVFAGLLTFEQLESMTSRHFVRDGRRPPGGVGSGA